MAGPDIAAISLRRFTSEASADDSFKSPGAQTLARYYGEGVQSQAKGKSHKSTTCRHNIPMAKPPWEWWKAQLIF